MLEVRWTVHFLLVFLLLINHVIAQEGGATASEDQVEQFSGM